jgi:hypothetical protein
MRVDLSVEKFTAVLAALGTSAAIACGGATPQPVQANEVTLMPAATKTQGAAKSDTTPATTSPDTAGAQGGGAAPSEAPRVAPVPASTPGANAPAAVASSPPSASPAGTAASTGTKPPTPKGGAKAAPPKPASAGEASCGAGTCSGDMKKKIL